MKHQGIVNVITSKQFDAKPNMPAATLYGFALKGVDGFFGLGKNKPAFQKGDFVSFEADAKNKVIGEVTIGQTNYSSGHSAAHTADAPAAKSNYAQAEDSRQKLIAWQAARNAAIEMVKVLQIAGELPLPKQKGKASEALFALVEEFTLRLFQDTYTAPSRPVTPEELDVPTDADDDGSFEE